MAKTFVAGRPIDVGSPEGDVKHYEEGDVVPGAESFENLKGLLDNGYLREKVARGSGSKEPKAKSTAKRASRSRARTGPRT